MSAVAQFAAPDQPAARGQKRSPQCVHYRPGAVIRLRGPRAAAMPGEPRGRVPTPRSAVPGRHI